MTATSEFATKEQYTEYLTYLAEQILVDAIRRHVEVTLVIEEYVDQRMHIVQRQAGEIMEFTDSLHTPSPRRVLIYDLRRTAKDLIAWD